MPPTSRRRFLLGTTAALGAGTAATLGLPGTASAAPRAVATLYIAGDSTAQTYNSGYYPQAGWGQTLPGFFTSNITVANRAIGGRSSRSFIEQGRLSAIHDVIKPGDYLFVQWRGQAVRWVNPARRPEFPAKIEEWISERPSPSRPRPRPPPPSFSSPSCAGDGPTRRGTPCCSTG
ncbi:hypothetical protein [Streptomyces sp. NPDC056730]|uniref:hypothetical protein n=1 Tax=unclassified Streptomyces TaxID=2593676 RepID=UPI003685D609